LVLTVASLLFHSLFQLFCLIGQQTDEGPVWVGVIDYSGTLLVQFDDADLSRVNDEIQLSLVGSEVLALCFHILVEGVFGDFLLKFCSGDEEVLLSLYFALSGGSRGVRDALFENLGIGSHQSVNDCALSNAWRSANDDGLILDSIFVDIEVGEVVSGVFEDFLRFFQQHGRHKVIEDFSDFWVLLHVLLVFFLYFRLNLSVVGL